MSRPLLGLATCLLLCLAVLQSAPELTLHKTFAVSAQATTTSIAQPTPSLPQVNIARHEYDNALARWRARGVLEYEMTLVDSTYMGMGGNIRLRFWVKSGDAKLTSYTDLNGDQPRVIPLSTLSADDVDYLNSLSIESRFNLIESVFTGKIVNTPDYASYFDIAFDPILGYPTNIHSGSPPATRGPGGSRPGRWRR